MSADVGAAVQRGVRLFNRGRYLSAQQTWEDAWREAAGDDRGFLEGLVQLAGALHLRTRRAATRGAIHLLSQALILLDDHRPRAHGVDVESLATEFNVYLDWIKTVDRPHRLLDTFRIPRLR